MANFCSFFHTATVLAALVRELHISGNSITFPAFCLCHALPTLLSAFPNLQDLSVSDIHADCTCKMSSIRSQQELRRGLRRVAVRVKYHTPVQVAAMLAAFEDLESLEVLSATKVVNSNPVDFSLNPQAIPRHLVVRSYDAIFPMDVLFWRLFRSSPDLSNLQSIQTSFYHGEAAEEFMNLLLCAHNIRALDFRVSIAQSQLRSTQRLLVLDRTLNGSVSGVYSSMDLSICHNLESITLRLSGFVPITGKQLCAMLKPIAQSFLALLLSCPPSLSSVTIGIRAGHVDKEQVRTCLWSQLHPAFRALNQLTSFRLLIFMDEADEAKLPSVDVLRKEMNSLCPTALTSVVQCEWEP